LLQCLQIHLTPLWCLKDNILLTRYPPLTLKKSSKLMPFLILKIMDLQWIAQKKLIQLRLARMKLQFPKVPRLTLTTTRSALFNSFISQTFSQLHWFYSMFWLSMLSSIIASMASRLFSQYIYVPTLSLTYYPSFLGLPSFTLLWKSSRNYYKHA
jgi:hypothetical protein